MAWEDWRNLRAQIFLNFSEDYGRSWKIYNVPLTRPDDLNRTLTSSLNPLFVNGGRYNLLVQEFIDDKFSQFNLKRLVFDGEDLQRLALEVSQMAVEQPVGMNDAGMTGNDGPAKIVGNPLTMSAAGGTESQVTELALRKRVEDYWQAMVDHKFDVTYAMQDPFFRAKNSMERYSKPMGRIVYRDPIIEGISLEGPLATVRVRMTVGIKPFRAKTGEMISRPDQTISFDETWLRFDGEWYKEFYDEYLDLKFTRY